MRHCPSDGASASLIWISYCAGYALFQKIRTSEISSLRPRSSASHSSSRKPDAQRVTISLEDLPIYQYFTPPQTTVHQPLQELARIAVEKMLELCDASKAGTLDPKAPPLDICLPSALVQRDSVARLTPVAPATPLNAAGADIAL